MTENSHIACLYLFSFLGTEGLVKNGLSLETVYLLSHTYFGFFRSLFSLQKAAIYRAPVARTVNYLCKRLMCLCLPGQYFSACVCFHLHIWSGCFLWDNAVSSTISPVRQDNNDISVNPLLPSSCLDYTQTDNRTVCRSVSCLTTLHKPTSRLSWVQINTIGFTSMILFFYNDLSLIQNDY